MQRGNLIRLLAFFTAGTMFMTSFAGAKQPEITKALTFSGAYLAGRAAAGDNHMDLAVAYFRQASAFKIPDKTMSNDLQHDILIMSLVDGNFKEAVEQANSIKDEPSRDHFYHLTLATDDFTKNKYENVKKHLKFKNPSELENITSGLLNAWAVFGSGDRNKAINSLKKLRGPVSYDIFVNYHMALMSDIAGKKQDAERYYSKALANRRAGIASPDTYERVINAYASFQSRNNNKEGALKTIQIGEQNFSGRNVFKNMRIQLEKNLPLDMLVKTPQDGAGEALYNIGTSVKGELSENFTLLYLQLALALRPQNDATLYQIASILSQTSSKDKAIDFYKKIAPNSFYSDDAKTGLAFNLADLNDTDGAIKLLSELEQKYPDDQAISLALAGTYLTKTKDYGKAVEVMDRAIAHITDTKKREWFLYNIRGMAEERSNLWDKAEADFRKALELSPDQPDVLNYLGYSLIVRNEKLDEALKMVKRAVALSPQNGEIVDSLGWAYFKLGRYDDAVITLEQAIKLKPGEATINDHLGDAYWKVGRKLEATYQWKHALAYNPEPEDIAKIEEKLKVGLKDQTTSQ